MRKNSRWCDCNMYENLVQLIFIEDLSNSRGVAKLHHAFPPSLHDEHLVVQRRESAHLCRCRVFGQRGQGDPVLVRLAVPTEGIVRVHSRLRRSGAVDGVCQATAAARPEEVVVRLQRSHRRNQGGCIERPLSLGCAAMRTSSDPHRGHLWVGAELTHRR